VAAGAPEQAGPVIAVGWPMPDYLVSLRRAGARPRVLDPARDELPDVLEACDGVLLTGGADVDPVHYGADDRHPSVVADPARDSYELRLARAALDRDMPILAICRGAQLLNVVGGGSLLQDIASQRPSALQHRQPPRRRRTEALHDVTVVAGTCLARLLAPQLDTRGALPVNSRHHQAIDRVAPDFVVSATAPDGLIEAIERPAATFCVAVQWHPENFWRTGAFAGLFEGLVAAATASAPSRRNSRSASARP
jgi:putative glutamine amidotransferase